MPNYPLEALVLSKTKLGDSDLIFTLLAEDGAQVRAVAKGVRKPLSRLRGVLDVFARVSLLLAKGRNLDVVCEARPTDMHEPCRASYERICASETVCEAARKVTYQDRPQPQLFAMTDKALSMTGEAPSDHLVVLASAYLLKVASLVGYRPEFSRCARCGAPVGREPDGAVPFSLSSGGSLCPGCAADTRAQTLPSEVVSWLSALVSTTFDELSRATVDDATSALLLDLSYRWFLEHVGTRLRSVQFLQSL
ncbi:MAG: DNA repair protein RecO [Coriobacteriales bacterium]